MITMDIADPFARQLMARYLGHREQDLRNLREALDNGDFAMIRMTGHNMHGSGSAYGLDRISELGEHLESAADDADPQTISSLIDSLESYVRKLAID